MGRKQDIDFDLSRIEGGGTAFDQVHRGLASLFRRRREPLRFTGSRAYSIEMGGAGRFGPCQDTTQLDRGTVERTKEPVCEFNMAIHAKPGYGKLSGVIIRRYEGCFGCGDGLIRSQRLESDRLCTSASTFQRGRRRGRVFSLRARSD